jgi:hypothetical protein
MVKEITDAEETSQPSDLSEGPGIHTHSPKKIKSKKL